MNIASKYRKANIAAADYIASALVDSQIDSGLPIDEIEVDEETVRGYFEQMMDEVVRKSQQRLNELQSQMVTG